MLYIDQYVYQNKMRSSHPLEKVTFACVIIFCSVIVSKPIVHLAVMVVMLGLLILKAKIPFQVVGKLMLAPVVFLLLGGLAIAVTVSTSATGMLGSIQLGSFNLGVTEQGLTLAAVTLSKSLSATSALYFLVLTTPLTELLYVLQLLRMPSIIIDLGILVYRFIFVFLETAFCIYTAQSARLGFINFKRSVNSFGLLFASLWANAFFRSQTIYHSLLSRGYGETIKVLNPEFTFSRINVLTFTLLASGIITLAIAA